MSAALVTSENPDSDFVLRGQSPYYIERTSFYPTKSDITSTTRNLSQHAYRADAYKDVLEDDQTLHSSLRSVSRSLRQVSNNIAKCLLEESTAKGNYSKVQANGLTKDVPVYDREWLSGVNWQTSSGRQVSFTQSFPPTTWHHPNRSHSSLDFVNEMQDNQREAEELLRIVNTEMHLADVPATRFTRKDLLAAEYFPVTMSESDFDVSSTRRSRSRTRKSNQVKASPLLKAPITDNYQAMKHLEKLYFVASEAPGTAAATIAIMSPYQEEMGRLRLERLRLEEEHLKELRRLSELERSRGPKPKWYELKGPQFHFEAQKNNDILRSQERWKDIARKEDVLARTSQEFQRSLMRAVSF